MIVNRPICKVPFRKRTTCVRGSGRYHRMVEMHQRVFEYNGIFRNKTGSDTYRRMDMEFRQKMLETDSAHIWRLIWRHKQRPLRNVGVVRSV